MVMLKTIAFTIIMALFIEPLYLRIVFLIIIGLILSLVIVHISG